MKALVKTKTGVGNVELLDVPKPEAGAGQVVLEVKAAGVCGTDVHIYYDEFKVTPPVILGHEVAGVVVEIGEDVTDVELGERVTTESYFKTCGLCLYCRSGHENLCLNRLSIGSRVNGGMTKYVVVPSKNVHRLPENIDFNEGCLTEPLACVIHSTLDRTEVTPGDIAVISGPGPIGLLTLQVAKQAGAIAMVIGAGRDVDRLRVAKELGADHTVNVEKEDPTEVINRLSGGYGADVVFECAGVEASAEMCLRLVRRQGQYTQIGLMGKPVGFDLDQIIFKEVVVRGGNASVPTAWLRALKLMEIGKVKIKPLISHVLRICDWEKALEIFREKSGLKIVLTPID
jgi:L-iditol 2-dehydrogenase